VVYPYLFVDAKVEKVHDGRRVARKAVVIAHAVHETGRREIIGLDVGAAETGVLRGPPRSHHVAGRDRLAAPRHPPSFDRFHSSGDPIRRSTSPNRRRLCLARARIVRPAGQLQRRAEPRRSSKGHVRSVRGGAGRTDRLYVPPPRRSSSSDFSWFRRREPDDCRSGQHAIEEVVRQALGEERLDMFRDTVSASPRSRWRAEVSDVIAARVVCATNTARRIATATAAAVGHVRGRWSSGRSEDRSGQLRPELPQTGKRTGPALVSVLQQACVCGVSTRGVDRTRR
jgi:hypothetical protein